MKKFKFILWFSAAPVLVVHLGLAIVRYYLVLGYPRIGGGYQISSDGRLTAKSLAITERPFFGNDRHYYQFELVRGGQDGLVLKRVIVEALPGEEFRNPRSAPAFPIKWSAGLDAVTFSAQGIDLTLQE